MTVPSFDIVRVEPSGDTVVAGRAAPGSAVTLMASGKPVASATADPQGQFVIVPPALRPGSHELTLSQTGSGAATKSSQSVAVSVPERGKQEVMVALAEPEKPTRILTEPTAPGAPPELAIRSVEAEGGGLFASGAAAPGARLMIYLNDGHIAQAIADRLGQWSLRISRGMTPGQYTVRADQIDEAGKVLRRVETPFSYAPQIAASATPPSSSGAQSLPTAPPSSPSGPNREPDSSNAARPTPTTPSPASGQAAGDVTGAATPAEPAASSSNVTVEQIATAHVVRGDSLWRISRRMLGKGVRYTQIYDANTAQIRDPHRIYPGQILVVPVDTPAPDPAEKR